MNDKVARVLRPAIGKAYGLGRIPDEITGGIEIAGAEESKSFSRVLEPREGAPVLHHADVFNSCRRPSAVFDDRIDSRLAGVPDGRDQATERAPCRVGSGEQVGNAALFTCRRQGDLVGSDVREIDIRIHRAPGFRDGVLVKGLGLHDERQKLRQQHVRIFGLDHEGRIGGHPLEVRKGNLAEVGPARSIEDVAAPKSHVESRSEVPVTHGPPPTDAKVVRVHVFAGDIASESGGGGVNVVLDLTRDFAEGNACPVGLEAAAIHRTRFRRRSARSWRLRRPSPARTPH